MSGRRTPVAGDSATLSIVGLRDRQATARFRPSPARPVLALESSSLHWVASLLPSEERTVWWAEVTSCLAETADPDQRRRYVRSYRRSVPQLVWTSWTSQVRCVAPAPVGVGYSSVKWKGTIMANLS